MRAVGPRPAGFTLVELLVVLVLLVPIWAAVLGVAATGTRTATATSRLASAEAAVANTIATLEAELLDLSPGRDLVLIDAGRLRFHAGRGAGRTCDADSTGVRVVAATWLASRLPVPGRDSLWIEQVALDSSGWRAQRRVALEGPVQAGTCPGGAPAIHLPADLAAILLPGLALGPVVRTTEVIELSAYSSGGQDWFGLRHLGIAETVQPVAGPFVAGGLRFEGYDAAGGVTTDAARVRVVGVQAATPSPQPVQREARIVLRR